MIAQGQVVAIAGTSDVRALVDGRVLEVAVREGEPVAAGRLLARIGTAEIDAAIAAALGLARDLVRSTPRLKFFASHIAPAPASFG